MRKTNFHTHCRYCDGSGEPADYIKYALKNKFECIGFSSHCALPFDTEWTMNYTEMDLYLSEIRRLREEYSDKIKILLGLETDYIEEYSTLSGLPKMPDTDYIIGSVHLIKSEKLNKYLAVDFSPEEFKLISDTVYKSDTRLFVEDYYRKIRKMIRKFNPDILGHLDLIKKNNKNSRFFNEKDKWYIDSVTETLEVLSRSSSILEINSGGMSRGTIDTAYPSEWILKEACKLNIPVCISSDAHKPEWLDFGFKYMKRSLLNAGYTHVTELTESGRVSTPIEL